MEDNTLVAAVSWLLGECGLKHTYIPMIPIRRALNYLEVLMLLNHYNFPNIINVREPRCNNKYITVREPIMNKRLCDLLEVKKISDTKMKSMVIKLLKQLMLLDEIGFSGIKVSESDVYVDNNLDVFIGDVHKKCFKNRFKSSHGMTYFTILSLFNIFKRLINFINPNITYLMTLEEMLLILDEKDLNEMLIESCSDKYIRMMYYRIKGDKNTYQEISIKDIKNMDKQFLTYYDYVECQNYNYNNNYSMIHNQIKEAIYSKFNTLKFTNDSLGKCTIQYVTIKIGFSKIIRRLFFNDTELCDTGVEHLSEFFPNLPNLELIDLSRNAIGKRGITSFMRNTKYLKKLDELMLEGNRIDDECMIIIVDNIINIRKIVILNLNNNLIEDFGIEYMIPQLHLFNHLSILYIENNRFGEEGFKSLVKSYYFLKKINIRMSGGITPIDVDGIMEYLNVEDMYGWYVNLFVKNRRKEKFIIKNKYIKEGRRRYGGNEPMIHVDRNRCDVYFEP